MLSFIILVLGYFVGLGIASFTLIPILIILRFGIPFTKKLEKQGGLVKNNNIVRNYFFSMGFLAIVYYGLFKLSGVFSIDLQWGFVIGTAFSLITGLKQTGRNEANSRDYFDTNKEKIILPKNE